MLYAYMLYYYFQIIRRLLLCILAGRFCEWKFKSYDRSSEMETFNAFFDSLKLSCKSGDVAVLNWTVAEETPDLVYYQVRMYK